MHIVLVGTGNGAQWRGWCRWQHDAKEMGAVVGVVVERELEGVKGDKIGERERRNIIPHI